MRLSPLASRKDKNDPWESTDQFPIEYHAPTQPLRKKQVKHPGSRSLMYEDAQDLSTSFALQVIPAAQATQRGVSRREEESLQLITAMQSLVIDQRHPVALEMSGTQTERRLHIRARTPEALAHVKTQLYARFPQMNFIPLAEEDDPFHLGKGENVSAVELQAGNAAYLPLQDFTRMREHDDPVLGILAALDTLPTGLRIVTQIALVPAQATWSQAYQRKAVEHALEPERQKERLKLMLARQDAGAPGLPLLILGGGILAICLLYQKNNNTLPRWLAWIPALLLQLLHGGWGVIWNGPQQGALMGLIGIVFATLLLLLFIQRFIINAQRQPLYDMRSVERKTSRSAYHIRLRLFAIGPRTDLFASTHQHNRHTSVVQYIGAWYEEKAKRQQYLARVVAAYRQYHLASGNYFRPKRIQGKGIIRDKTWGHRIERSPHLLDVEALAALWHMPPASALPELANMTYRHSRSRLLPPGLQAAQNERQIGTSEHAGHTVSFGLPAKCLHSHMLIAGKSGEGKSTLIEHIALRTMLEQSGMILIDPHGDLAEGVLRLVPPDRSDDVVLIDLSDEQFACGINPLDVGMAHGRDKTIADLIKILSHIWSSAWGSRMEIAFEYALRTLYEANKVLCQQGEEGRRQQYTLLDVMAVLTDESFCHSLLDAIHDPFIQRWWATYYDPLSVQMQRDRIDPVLSKVAKFEGSIARHILGQSVSTIDLTKCIQEEKIVLIKLAKGVVGEDVARILGATLLGLVQITLEEQGRLDREERKHLPIFLDEFQTLQGVDWGALAELRKYGATFFLATQSLEYLRELDILPVVTANVKQLAIFRLNHDDARLLASELDVEPEDVVHLDSLTCYLKLLYARRQQATFSLHLNFPPRGDAKQADMIRDACQTQYMRPVTTIDRELFEHLAAQISAQTLADEERKENTHKSEKKTGLARQDGGNRGRRKNNGSQRRSQERSVAGYQQKPDEQAEEQKVMQIIQVNETEIEGTDDDQMEVDPHEQC